MKIVVKLGCLMLMSIAVVAVAGCKKTAQSRNNSVSNTKLGKPAPSPRPSAFSTEEKTPKGEDIYRMETGGIKFVLPKTWSAMPDESLMTLASEDNALRVIIVVPENTDYDGVVNSLSDELAKLIQNAKPDGVASRTKLNGMTALTQHGVGDMDDTSVSWKIDVVKAKRPIIILSYATIQIDEPHNADYSAFMDSILPLG